MTLTRDAFLNGKVMAWQPAKGYRAATDAVFLAAAVPARPGQTALELGCGVGVASLCLKARVPGVDVIGVELQEAYAELARRNGLTVHQADLTGLPADIRGRSFDHVLANPPYFDPARSQRSADPGRDAAFREETPLADWIDVGLRRLKSGGVLTLIHRTERLPQVLACIGTGASVSVRPLQSRHGREAGRFVLWARKGGRAAFVLKSPLTLHAGTHHESDAEDFSREAASILRDGAPLN